MFFQKMILVAVLSSTVSFAHAENSGDEGGFKETPIEGADFRCQNESAAFALKILEQPLRVWLTEGNDDVGIELKNVEVSRGRCPGDCYTIRGDMFHGASFRIQTLTDAITKEMSLTYELYNDKEVAHAGEMRCN